MYRNPSLTRYRIEELIKVKVFLNSIERNSRESRNAYHRGLIHFQNFLDEKYLTLTVESILQPLIRNEINASPDMIFEPVCQELLIRSGIIRGKGEG